MRASTVAVLVLAVTAAACGSGTAPAGPFGDGKAVYGDVCSACHGSRGEGGTGPALDEVTETFPTCDEHVTWIALGSERWMETAGDTYGATSKPVTGGMPSLEESLTQHEIAAAAAYERAEFGKVERSMALVDCGFAGDG